MSLCLRRCFSTSSRRPFQIRLWLFFLLRKLKRCIKSALLAAQCRVLASHSQRTERSHTDRWGSRKWERRGAAAPAKQSANSFKSVDECDTQPLSTATQYAFSFHSERAQNYLSASLRKAEEKKGKGRNKKPSY